MADPTIQTFCCHIPNMTNRGVQIMMEFNTDNYNTVCLLSSVIGIFGALYQILPRTTVKLPHRWYALSASRGRQIVVWLALADLLASTGVFTRSALWLNLHSLTMYSDNSTNVLICSISSAWIQYFYMVTWFWTLCYAIDMRFVLQEKEGHPKLYHSFSWGAPAVLTSIGLAVLYYPDANCHDMQSPFNAIFRILPNYCATYIPIAVVMIVNPILYKSSTRDVANLIAVRNNQFTSKEREVVDAIKIKFCLINLAFYFCWIPNLINGFLLWTLWFHLPENIIIGLWYIMAVTNPLQALCNSLVYRRWSSSADKFYVPWQRESKTQPIEPDNSGSPSAGISWPQMRHVVVTEDTPLLQTNRYKSKASSSINGSFSES